MWRNIEARLNEVGNSFPEISSVVDKSVSNQMLCLLRQTCAEKFPTMVYLIRQHTLEEAIQTEEAAMIDGQHFDPWPASGPSSGLFDTPATKS